MLTEGKHLAAVHWVSLCSLRCFTPFTITKSFNELRRLALGARHGNCSEHVEKNNVLRASCRRGTRHRATSKVDPFWRISRKHIDRYPPMFHDRYGLFDVLPNVFYFQFKLRWNTAGISLRTLLEQKGQSASTNSQQLALVSNILGTLIGGPSSCIAALTS